MADLQNVNSLNGNSFYPMYMLNSRHMHVDDYVLVSLGQIKISLMVDPPLPGDDSCEQFCHEETDIFESLVVVQQLLSR